MQIQTNHVDVLFNNTCPKCSHLQNNATNNIVKIAIDDLVLYVGVPICEKCGEELTMLATVEIKNEIFKNFINENYIKQKLIQISKILSVEKDADVQRNNTIAEAVSYVDDLILYISSHKLNGDQ